MEDPALVWHRALNNNIKNTTPTSSSSSSEQELFRQRFLQALKFYTQDNPSPQSQTLPSEVTSSLKDHPLLGLQLIIQVKKGGGGVPSSSSLLGKLLKEWMNQGFLAQILVSLSLKEEEVINLSECSNLQRLIFILPDTFNIPSPSFQTYLFTQWMGGVEGLGWGIREGGYQGVVRTQVLSHLLDRIFLRFHSDQEQFFSQTKSILNKSHTHKKIYEVQGGEDDPDPPFPKFLKGLGTLCKTDFISRRLVSKALLGLGSISALKVARGVFLVGVGETCPATSLFFPPEEFLDLNPTWGHTLKFSIPLKTQTKSKLFWSNWANFVFTSSPSVKNEVWETSVKNWESLCLSSAVNIDILIPSTYALIALGRKIKEGCGAEGEEEVLESVPNILDSFDKCLNSTNEEKIACGMALVQVVGDLHGLKMKKMPHPQESSNKDKGPVGNEGESKLKFQGSNPIFLEMIDFYENGISPEEEVLEELGGLKIKNEEERGPKVSKPEVPPKNRYEVLDSDDDIEDEEDEDSTSSDKVKEYLEQNIADIPVDERVLDYRKKKGRLPSYYSEFMEILVEGKSNCSSQESKGSSVTPKDEGEEDVMKSFCVMRTAILFGIGIRMDGAMAEGLAKCLTDFDFPSSLDIPITLVLYELALVHPIPLFETLAKQSLEKEHLSSGQRVQVLRRFHEIIQLLSKTKCISCFEINPRHKKELMSICPEFFFKYFEVKKKIRTCKDCAKGQGQPKKEEEEQEDLREQLTWQEIVDKRVKAKTRYFFTPLRKTPVIVQDEYSSKFVPIAWASIANRLLSKGNTRFFLDEEQSKLRGVGHDLIVSQMFKILGALLLGVGGSSCPHLGSIASQVGDLTAAFSGHPDPHVRNSVFRLLAVVITMSDAAPYVIEALTEGKGRSILDLLKILRDKETAKENQALLDSLGAFLMQAATKDYRIHQFQFHPSSGGSELSSESAAEAERMYSKLRFLPDSM